jgi:hypothetical protein
MKNLSALKAASAGRRLMGLLRIVSNVADGEVVTIGSESYEFDTSAAPGAVTAGRIRVDVSGGVTPGNALTALTSAINASTALGIVAKKISGSEATIATSVSGATLGCAGPIPLTTTMAGSNNGWAWPHMEGLGGVPIPVNGPLAIQMQQRCVSAVEAAIGTMRFYFPFKVQSAIVQIADDSNMSCLLAFTGYITPSGSDFGRVDVVNSGAGTFASNDMVTIFASA